MAALATKFVEQRGSRRVPLTGRVYYTYSDGTGVHASAGCWRDISRRGACLRLGRYLTPGRFLLLELPKQEGGQGQSIQVKACVAWCQPLKGSSHFLAGVQLYRSEPEVTETVNGMLKAATDNGDNDMSDIASSFRLDWRTL